MTGAMSSYSWFSVRREHWTRDAYNVWTPSMELLPSRYAPIEKQIRVVVDGVEYTYDDGTDPTLSTNLWTYAEKNVTAGIPCWGVRLNIDSINESAGNTAITTEVSVWDEDGNVVAMDSTWTDDGAQVENALDLDTTSRYEGPDEGAQITLAFPRQIAVSKVGWTRSNINYQLESIGECQLEVNVGTPTTPIWRQVAEVSGLTGGDYPSISNPYDPETMTYQLSVDADQLGGTMLEVMITPTLENLSSRLTIFRETRQDRPWVEPVNGGYGIGQALYWFFKQRLFIFQDLCDLNTLAGLISLPPVQLFANDYTGGAQSVLDVGGSSRTEISWDGIELLTGIPGAPSDARHQLTVERGNKDDGTSTGWVELTYNASPASSSQYSVDSSGKTITLGASEDNDIRIRRVTKLDDLWADINQLTAVGWNTAIITLIQKQLRFLWEEACYLPQFYSDDAIFSNPIFPRAWNWLVYVGTDTNFPFGGPYWSGDGTVVVYVNDLPLTEGVDYEIVFPNIVIPDLDDDDVVAIGIGSGGLGFSNPGSDEDNGQALPDPGTPPTPASYPGADIPTNLGIDIKVGAVPKEFLEGTEWEGYDDVGAITTDQGNSPAAQFNGHYMRVEAEVTAANKVSDGLGGYLAEGVKEVLYLAKLCGTAARMYVAAAAADTDANGSWDSAVSGDAGIGCGGGNGTGAEPPLDIIQTWLDNDSSSITNFSPFQLRMVEALFNMQGAIVSGNLDNVSYIQQWQQLVGDSVSAETAGQVSDSGFTQEQFEDYLDPDTSFTDFVIPVS
jgi:hypothetical protein